MGDQEWKTGKTIPPTQPHPWLMSNLRPGGADHATGNATRVSNLEVGFAVADGPLRQLYSHMASNVRLDPSNRIKLPPDTLMAAGVMPKQRFKVSATPGRIVLEIAPVPKGKVVPHGKLRVWTGAVPATPLAKAVAVLRHGRD